MAVTINNSTSLSALVTGGADSEYTFCAYAKLTTDWSIRLYIDGSPVGEWISIDNGTASLYVNLVTTTAAAPLDNAWHHLALVREDATTLKVYLDGALLMTGTTASAALPVIRMGIFAYPAKTIRAAHCMGWGYAMSAAEVALQAASYYPIASPLFWWPFPSAANLLLDYASNGRTGTVTGSGTATYLADPAYPVPDPPILPPDSSSAPASAPTWTPTAQTITLGTAYNRGAFWIDVEDAAGNRLGAGPLQALKWQSSARIDGAGKFSCEVLASDPQAAQLQKRRILRAWSTTNGEPEEVGAGIIESITTTIGADGVATLNIAGDDLLRELAWRSMAGQRLAYQSGGAWVPVTHAQAVTLIDYYTPPSWSFYAAPAAPTDSIYGQFVGESVLQACIALAKITGTHFYRGSGRSLIFASGWYESGMVATNAGRELRPEICAITDLQVEDQSYDLIARIYPYGAGQGAARLTLAGTTRTAPAGYMLSTLLNFIEHSATVGSFGQAVANVQFAEIAPISNTDPDVEAASNALFDAALEYLRQRVEKTSPTYRITLAQCARVLKPTQTIRVLYRNAAMGITLDATLNILEAVVQVDADGIRTTAITVTAGERWPDGDAATVVQAIQGGRQYQAHPQLNANAYVIPYSKNLDDDQTNPANFRFRFDAEVTQISRVTFDFQLLPLESTVKSVGGSSTTTAANGDHTHTVTIANHTHSVTLTGHTHSVSTSNHTHTVTIANHTHTIPNHTHYIKLTGGSSPTYPIGFGAAGTAGGLVHNASGSDFNYPTNSDSGSTTSNSGGSSTPTSSSGGGETVSSTSGGGTTATSSSGGGSTPTSASGGSHTHTLTPTITTVYGVYRDSGANTFAVTDLEYTLDAATWYNFAAGVNGYEVLGGGWYRVDLTTLLQAPSSYRPRAASNLLQIRRKTGGATKKATIDAQLNIRTIIQALALT